MYFLTEYTIASMKYFPPSQIKSLDQANSVQEPWGQKKFINKNMTTQSAKSCRKLHRTSDMGSSKN